MFKTIEQLRVCKIKDEKNKIHKYIPADKSLNVNKFEKL